MIVSKDSLGLLSTDLFVKETDTHQFLHNTSAHPGHCKNSLAFSQTLRYRRICSSADRARFHADQLERFLVRRGYSGQKVRQAIERAFKHDLSFRRNAANVDERNNLVMTFHPGLPNISAELKELHRILSVDPRLSAIFPSPPRVTFRRPKNLKNYLVRARVSTRESDGNQTATYQRPFCGPCNGRSNCAICKILPYQQEITSKNNESFSLQCGRGADCNSKNVVYCVTCLKCRLQYVGCTSNKLRLRINQHKSNIRNTKNLHQCYRLYDHFTQKSDHSLADIQLTVLATTSSANLENVENFWIIRLNSIHPHGLNTRGNLHSNRL